MVSLGVNIDHVATLRNARGGDYPDPIQAALLAVLAALGKGFFAIFSSVMGTSVMGWLPISAVSAKAGVKTPVSVIKSK